MTTINKALKDINVTDKNIIAAIKALGVKNLEDIANMSISEDQLTDAGLDEAQATQLLENAQATTAPSAAPVTPAVTADPQDAIIARLKGIGIMKPEDQQAILDIGVESVDDLEFLEKPDLIATGVKPVQANKLIAALRKDMPTAAPAAAAATAGYSLGMPPRPAAAAQVYELGDVPGVKAIIAKFKSGGIQYFTSESAAYALQAVAMPNNFFDVPKILLSEAQHYYLTVAKKPYPAAFEAVKSMVRQTAYADILRELGRSGTVTDPSRDYIINTARSKMLKATHLCYLALLNCRDDDREERLLSGPFAAFDDMADEPSLEGLYTAVENLVDCANETLAADGEKDAIALGGEMDRISDLIADEANWVYVGARTLEEFKSKLKIDEANTMADVTEHNLVKFVYHLMLANESKDYTRQLIKALVRCGKNIGWTTLGFSDPAVRQSGGLLPGRSGLPGVGGGVLKDGM
jgi:hypothetical protein